MSYALLDAARVAKAAEVSLGVLKSVTEKSEAHTRKVIMIERIEALAKAASESGQGVTLTSEEFWLISRNW